MNGDFIVGGSTDSFGPGLQHVYLLRLDENGDTLWTKILGEADATWALSIKESRYGGFIIGGSASDTSSDMQGLLIRTDESGDSLWMRAMGGIGNDCFEAVMETEIGEVMALGFAYNTVTLSRDL
jgi:hypothetical protein